MNANEEKIKVGIDLGTSYSYAGEFKDGKFHSVMGESDNELGMLSLAQFCDYDMGNESVCEFCFGSDVEKTAEKFEQIIEENLHSKKKLLDAVDGKQISDRDKKRHLNQLKHIVQFLLCRARARNHYVDENKNDKYKKIDAVVVGMPALPKKKREAYIGLMYDCVMRAAEFANNNDPVVQKIRFSGKITKNDFDFFNRGIICFNRRNHLGCRFPGIGHKGHAAPYYILRTNGVSGSSNRIFDAIGNISPRIPYPLQKRKTHRNHF